MNSPGDPEIRPSPDTEAVPPCKRMRRREDGSLEVIEEITDRPRQSPQTYFNVSKPRGRRPGRPRKDHATPVIPQTDEIIAMCNQGKAIQVISKHFGVAVMTIWKRIDEYRKAHPGYQIPNAKRNPVTAEIILALRSKGVSVIEIAKRYGCTTHTIYGRVREYKYRMETAGGLL